MTRSNYWALLDDNASASTGTGAGPGPIYMLWSPLLRGMTVPTAASQSWSLGHGAAVVSPACCIHRGCPVFSNGHAMAFLSHWGQEASALSVLTLPWK